MPDEKVYHCNSCGAPLNVISNKAFVFCPYCGSKNYIQSQQMTTNIDVGGIQIKTNTDIDSILESVEYAISIKQYEKANDLLLSSIMSGNNDYRVYILKAEIDLLTDNNNSLFQSIQKLISLEYKQSNQSEVTNAIRNLMHYRGINGVTVLHNATFHELYDMVVYCVNHGSDVNCVAGMNRVTPISIMFVPISSNLSRLDGTPFIRNRAEVKRIRDYLLAHGAYDHFRAGY